MQSPQERRTQRKLTSPPRRTFSPPLSPPPTSPLPRPPSSPIAKQMPSPKQILREQTSLPSLAVQRRCSIDSEKHWRLNTYHPQSLRTPHQRLFKSSSDSNLPNLSKLKLRNGSRVSPDIPEPNTSPHNTITNVPSSTQKSRVAFVLPSGSSDQPRTLRGSEAGRMTNRSTTPPRKAIARSALYIPITSHCPQTSVCTSDEIITISVPENDTITSLPRCPSGDDLARLLQQYPNTSTSKNIWQQKFVPCIQTKGDVVFENDRPDGLRAKRSPKAACQPHGQFKQKTAGAVVTRPEIAVKDTLPTLTEDREGQVVSAISFRKSAKGRCEEGPGIDTQDRPRYLRHTRLLWILLTVVFVLIATAGVLGGVLWRLSTK